MVEASKTEDTVIFDIHVNGIPIKIAGGKGQGNPNPDNCARTRCDAWKAGGL